MRSSGRSCGRVVDRAVEWYIVRSSGRSCVLVVDRAFEW